MTTAETSRESISEKTIDKAMRSIKVKVTELLARGYGVNVTIHTGDQPSVKLTADKEGSKDRAAILADTRQALKSVFTKNTLAISLKNSEIEISQRETKSPNLECCERTIDSKGRITIPIEIAHLFKDQAFVYHKKEDGRQRIIISTKQVDLPGYAFFTRKITTVKINNTSSTKITLRAAFATRELYALYHPQKGYILLANMSNPDFSAETHETEISILEAQPD